MSDCGHPDAVLTYRATNSAYCLQCMTCGAAVPSAAHGGKVFIPHAEIDEAARAAAVPWDDEVRDAYVARRAADRAEAREQRQQVYERYLASPAWQSKRRRALARDRHRCQRCGSTAELDVHHWTYRHVGAEPLFELVTLCHDCHLAYHDG